MLAWLFRKESPLVNFDAALFDLDGTLTESEKLLYEAWVELAAASAADFRTFDYSRIIGRPDLECCRIVSNHFGLGKDPAAWHAEYKDILRRIDDRLTLRPYADRLVAGLWVASIPMALVTSAQADHAERSLAKFDLRRFFTAVVTADTPGLAARKPDPAPYRYAAMILDVSPERCIAFEDSPSGVRSAKAAGCFVFGCPHEHSPAEGLAEADVILTDLSDFSPGMVRR
jgi:HAD superfamily hydrolase (TIGR01509 family)